MKRHSIILLVLAVGMTVCPVLSAQTRKGRETIRMGGTLSERDSVSKAMGRSLDNRLFMPKKDLGLGVQFTYFDMTAMDSEFMMLLQNMDADGKYFSVAPFFTYAYKDNRSVGFRMKYSTFDAGVRNLDLSLLSDDLSFNISDLRGESTSMQYSVFQRSYVGLDRYGRLGLFSDISLSYSRTNTSFLNGNSPLDAYTVTDRIRLAAHPGLEVFVMNNVSTHFSVGIGGFTFTRAKNIKQGTVTGTRKYSNTRFMLDITDISMGITVHL